MDEVPEQENKAPPLAQQAQLAWTTGSCFGAGAGWPVALAAKGVDHDQVVVDEGALGGPFEAEFTVDGPHQDVRIYFYASSGEGTGSVVSQDPRVNGTVPDDARWAIFTSCGGLGASAAFEAWPPRQRT